MATSKQTAFWPSGQVSACNKCAQFLEGPACNERTPQPFSDLVVAEELAFFASMVFLAAWLQFDGGPSTPAWKLVK